MDELDKINELMVMGEDLEYAAIRIPSCSFEIETTTYTCNPGYFTSMRLSLDNVRQYFCKEESDPLRRLQTVNLDEYEAILMLRPKKRG